KQSQLDKYEVVKKKLKKEKDALAKATQKYQRSMGKLDRLAKANDRSIPKIVRNGLKMKAQVGFGTNKSKKEFEIEKLQNNLEDLRINKRKNIYLDLQYEKKKGLIISIEQGKMILPKNLELIKGINF